MFRIKSVLALGMLAILALAPMREADAGPKMPYKLRYKAELDHTEASRTVRLSVLDARDAAHGGNEPEKLGLYRGTFGDPRDLVNKGDPVDEYIRGWVSDLLGQHGIVVLVTEDQPELRVVIEEFWFAGGGTYVRLDIALRMELVPAGKTKPLVVHPFALLSEGTHSWGGYLTALRRDGNPALGAFIESGEFARVVGEPPTKPKAPAEPAHDDQTVLPPSTKAGCANDRDCKGKRICEGGACVNP